MRISADVAPDWKPKFLGMSLPFRDEKGMPSAENAIRNTITRAPLHKRWWLNDPRLFVGARVYEFKFG